MERVYLDMCSLERTLHLAFAERAAARWFVTCDDELLKLAGRLGDALRTLVVAPRALAWENES